MPTHLDYSIIGQGLAGTLCSFELLELGRTLRVVDAFDAQSPSRLAAGLMSPVSGQRTALIWRAPELLAQAIQTYKRLEKRLGRSFYQPLPLLRIYTDEEQRRRFRARAQEPAFQDYLGPELGPEALQAKGIQAPLGARLLLGTGWLDSAGLVSAWREELKKMGLLEERGFLPEDLDAGKTVACMGLGEQGARLFGNLKFQPTKGELLEIEEPGSDAGSIYYGSHFAIPSGGGRWRLGATYDRQDLSQGPTARGLETLSAAAAALFMAPVKILKHQAGLRPNLLGHFPVLGALPARPNLYVLNGFGSKGALWGPYCARALVGHMEEGEGLPSELDVARFDIT